MRSAPTLLLLPTPCKPQVALARERRLADSQQVGRADQIDLIAADVENTAADVDDREPATTSATVLPNAMYGARRLTVPPTGVLIAALSSVGLRPSERLTFGSNAIAPSLSRRRASAPVARICAVVMKAWPVVVPPTESGVSTTRITLGVVGNGSPTPGPARARSHGRPRVSAR